MIVNIGDVRIRRLDQMCVVIETKKEKTFIDRKTGEEKERTEEERWTIYGYYSNIKTALKGIYRDDLLIVDKEMNLEEFLNLNEEARKAVIDATKRLHEDK